MDIDEPGSTQHSELLDTQMDEQVPVLVFPESLLGAKKPLKVEELTLLLQILHEQLKKLDQNVDQSSLKTVTQELIHNKILKNTNKTVKALAACCIADIIRLHAPACPYSIDVLKSVFNLFIKELSYFGQESPDFQYHFYLLENLQTVKTFLLLNEMENTEDLVRPLVIEFFSVAEKGSLARNVEICMTDILIQLIEDVGILGSEIASMVVEQFERFEKGSSNPAYVMATDICYACPIIMQRQVCQHFSDELLNVSDSSSSEDLDDVKKAHDLIRKINTIMPDLLLNVLPLLQEEMELENCHIRQFAIETMGKMFADPSSNVAEKYPAIWKTWLGRRNDKIVQIRIAWLEMCIDIYKNYPALVPQLIESFKIKLSDPNEKVRATVCKILGEIGLEHDIQTLDKALLESLSERTKDKMSSVRTEAMKTIGSIYQNCYSGIQAKDETVITKVGWIPNQLMNCLYVGDASVLMNLESTLIKYIFPQEDNDTERAKRLVTVVGFFEKKQNLAFAALIRKQKSFHENLNTYIKMCEDAMNAGLNEHEVTQSERLMNLMAGQFPNKARTLNALRSFLNRESEQDVKLLKKAIDLKATYKQVHTTKDKLLSSLDNDQSDILEIFQAILNRACPLILNKSIVPKLLELSKPTRGRRRSAASDAALVARTILKEISTTYPTMYNDSLEDIFNQIMADNDGTAEEGLELLSEISKASKGEMVYTDKVLDRLTTYVNDGNVIQAEYAATALSNMRNADVTLADLAYNLSLELLLDKPDLLATLTSLSQFALYCHEVITPSIDSIVRFIESDLLNAKTKEFITNNPEWTSHDVLPELSQQKLAGVLLLVNYLTGSRDESKSEEYLVRKIFDILWSLLDRSCDGAVTDKTNAAETSHLRLAASQAIVKLTHYAQYTNELTVMKFERLNVSLQDTCFHVRQEFAQSLMKGLLTEQINSRYYALLFICAHEPDKALLQQVQNFLQKRFSTLEVLDTSLVRLIHMLAHHPDFTESVEDLMIFSQYFRFYLNCVATASNVSFLYHVAQKIKLSKDVVNMELNKNSYILSDLASLLIKTKCEEASWPLVAYGDRIVLPPKLYSPLPPAVQKEAIRANYLPTEFIKKFEEEQKHKIGQKRSRIGTSNTNKKLKT